MTFEELTTAITKDQVDTANDIDAYLMNTSVPMECNQHDIGVKLQASIDRIQLLLNNYAEEIDQKQQTPQG
ncbi:MAG: hypothetical protein EBU46_00195 [Nitrosomonadaceae bacterium]|nr:hypothetical protein [Nitrosomonadaceae bacterium]